MTLSDLATSPVSAGKAKDKVLMAYESLDAENKALLRELLLNREAFTSGQIADALNLTTDIPFNIEAQQVGHLRRKMQLGKVTLE